MTGRSMVERGQEYVDTVAINTDDERYGAALSAAAWVAGRYPHELDGQMPRLAGKLTGRNPQARRDLLDALAVLGLHNPPEEGRNA